MNSNMSHRRSRGIDVLDRARLVVADHTASHLQSGATASELLATLATRIYRRAQAYLRLRQRDEFDLVAYARSVEREMPNLASELRSIALRQP